jgi:hypothetical protein
MGVELYAKTLGLIGAGNIGGIVADRANGLKMKVVAYDPFLSAERAVEIGVEKVELDELFKRADFITLHTPLTEKTRNIIDAASLAKERLVLKPLGFAVLPLFAELPADGGGASAGARAGQTGATSGSQAQVEHMFTPGRLAQIRALGARSDIYDALVRSVAPSIWVLDDVKKGILCQLFGGVNKELAAGIAEGRIAARIDARAGVLYARHADARRATFQRALAAGAAYERDTKALLVRASLMQHDVVQRGSRREGGGGGGGGGHGPHGHGRGDPHFQRPGSDRHGIARAHQAAAAAVELGML